MNQIKGIRLLNEATITYLQKMGLSTERNEIIKKILMDETCFFKMNKSDAFIILTDIGIEKEKLEETYLRLISKDEYFYLQKKGKISENDKDLKIKYEQFEYNDLFKRNNK